MQTYKKSQFNKIATTTFLVSFLAVNNLYAQNSNLVSDRINIENNRPVNVFLQKENNFLNRAWYDLTCGAKFVLTLGLKSCQYTIVPGSYGQITNNTQTVENNQGGTIIYNLPNESTTTNIVYVPVSQPVNVNTQSLVSQVLAQLGNLVGLPGPKGDKGDKGDTGAPGTGSTVYSSSPTYYSNASIGGSYTGAVSSNPTYTTVTTNYITSSTTNTGSVSTGNLTATGTTVLASTTINGSLTLNPIATGTPSSPILVHDPVTGEIKQVDPSSLLASSTTNVINYTGDASNTLLSTVNGVVSSTTIGTLNNINLTGTTTSQNIVNSGNFLTNFLSAVTGYISNLIFDNATGTNITATGTANLATVNSTTINTQTLNASTTNSSTTNTDVLNAASGTLGSISSSASGTSIVGTTTISGPLYATNTTIGGDTTINGGTTTINGVVVNNAENIFNSTSTFNGPVVMNGELITNATVTNNGPIFNNGTTTNNGEVINNSTTTNNGTSIFNGIAQFFNDVFNYGNIFNYGTTTNNGIVINNNEVINNATTTNNGPVVNNGPVTNYGTTTLEGPVVVNGTTTFNGVVDLSNASVTFPNSPIPNATITNLVFTNATGTNLTLENASITNATVSNLFADILNAFSAFFTNLTATNATVTNLVSTNSNTGSTTATSLTVTGSSTLASTTINGTLSLNPVASGSATSSLLVYGPNGEVQQVTPAEMLASNTTNVINYTGDASNTLESTVNGILSTTTIGTLNNINLTGTTTAATITAQQVDTTGLTAVNATLTNATTSNLFATNASITNATTSNFFADVLSAITGYISNLIFDNATGTNITATGTASLANIINNTLTSNTATITDLTVNGSLTISPTPTSTSTTDTVLTIDPVTGEILQMNVSDINILTYLQDNVAASGTISYIDETGATTTISLTTLPNLTVTGNTTLATTTATNLSVSGTTTLAGPVYATNTTLGGDTIINGTTTISGTTTVSGALDLTNASVTGLSLDSATITNLVGTNASITNATTTNFFSDLLTALTGYFTNLFTQNLTASTTNTVDLLATNATLTNATITNLSTTNSLSATGNTLTSNVGGSIGTSSIITSNALTASGTVLTSTVNGVATSTDLQSIINAGTTNVLTVSTTTNSFTLTSTVNGVTSTTTANFIDQNSLTSAVNELTSVVNGVTSTSSIINSNTLTAAAGVITSTVNGVVATTSISSLYNFLASSTNSNLTVATDTLGNVTYIFTDNPIFGSATITNAVLTNATSTNLFSTNASITNATTSNFFADVLSAITGYISNLIFDNATGTNITATGTASLANIINNTLTSNTATITDLVSTNATFTTLSVPTSATTSGNVLTTNVAGSIATTTVITNNTLTTSGSNLVSNVNGVISTTSITDAVASATTNVLSYTGGASNTLESTVNGVLSTTSINTLNDLNLTGTTTITNLVGTNASITNATTSNFFSDLLTALTGYFTNLFTQNLTASTTNTVDLLATNATLTNATITNLSTTNSLSATGNTLTSNVGGSIGTSSIITSNGLTASGTVLTSTINGVATSTDLQSIINAGTTNVLTVSTSTNSFTLTSTVNGVTATTTANFINQNALTSAVNELTSVVNGVTSTSSIINSNTLTAAAGVITSTVNGVVATSSISSLYNFLASSTNSNLTVATDTLGNVTYIFTDNPIFGSATITNAVITNASTTNLFSTNASITNATTSNFFADILSAITGYISNLFFENATGTNLTSGNITATSTATLGTTTLTSVASGTATSSLLVIGANGEVQQISATSLLASNTTNTLTNASSTNSILLTNTTNGVVATTTFDIINSNQIDYSTTTGLFTSVINGVISTTTLSDILCNNALSGIVSFCNGGNTTGAPMTLGTNDVQPLNFEVNNITDMTIATSGFIGMGTQAPATELHMSKQVSGGYDMRSDSFGQQGTFVINRSSGTFAAPTTPANGAVLGTSGFGAWNSGVGDFTTTAFTRAIMDATTGANDLPTALTFSSTPDGTATPLERLRITNAGRIGHNTTAPIANFQSVNELGAVSSAMFDRYGNTADIVLRTANGTVAAPTAVTANQRIGRLAGQGYNGSTFSNNRATIDLIAMENWTTTANGTAMAFSTTATGTNSLQTRMRIEADGNVGIGLSGATNRLHVAGTIDPVRFEGLQTGNATNSIVVADSMGVLKTLSASTILASSTTNTLSNSSSTNSIILTNTTNGVVATTTFNLVNSNIISTTTNSFTSTVNGIASAVVNFINSLTTSATGNVLTTTINGVVATSSIITNSTSTFSGGILSTNINGVIATTSLAGLVTADNGLTINPANNVQLGGTLIQNTTVDGQGFDLSFIKNRLLQLLGNFVEIGQDGGNTFNGSGHQVAIGNANTLNTDFNTAIGDKNTVGGDQSIVVGYENILDSNNNSYVVGFGNKSIVSSKDNYFMGESNDFSAVSGSHVDVFGSYNIGSGNIDRGLVVGFDNTLNHVDNGGIFGFSNVLDGVINSFAIGSAMQNVTSNTIDIGLDNNTKSTIDQFGRFYLRGPFAPGGNDGNTGEILTSQGYGAVPVWSSPASILAGATTNALSFATSTGLLTSTVNGIPATTTLLGMLCQNTLFGTFAFCNGGNTSGANAVIGTNDNFNLGFETNNVEKMTLFSLANPSLGIGRTSLTGVNGGASSYSGPTLFTGAAGNFSGSTGWDFIMDDDNNATNNQIRFRANGDGAANTIDIMTVDEVSGGRVGIGNTAPGNKLEITQGTSGNSGLRFTNLTSSNSSATTSNKVLTVNSSGDVVLATVPGTENIVEFSVNANPNIAGTTFSPNQQNDPDVIYTSTIDNSTWKWNGSTYVTYTPTPTLCNVGSQFHCNNGNLTGADRVLGTNDNFAQTFETNNLERMRISNTGNVSIGTTTTNYKFSVVDTASAFVQTLVQGGGSGGGIINRLVNDSGKQYFVGVGGSSNGTLGADAFFIRDFTLGQNRIVVASTTGNVGIGNYASTMPSHKLTVQGTLGTANTRLEAYGSNTQTGVNTGDGVILADASGILQRIATSTFASSLLGGTASKVATFAGDIDVTGTIDPTRILFSGLNNSGSLSPTYTPSANGNAYRIEFGEGGHLNFKSDTTSDILHLTNLGDVGVGTSAPTAKFHINTALASTSALKITDGTNYTLRSGYQALNTGYFGGATGTALALGADDKEWARLTTDGVLGLRTSTPNTTPGFNSNALEFWDADGAHSDFTQRVAGGGYGTYNMLAQGGTLTAPTISAANQRLGMYGWGGYTGSSFNYAAVQYTDIDGTPSATSMPGKMKWATTPAGSLGFIERMVLDSKGNLGLGNSFPVSRLHVSDATTTGDVLTVQEPSARTTGANIKVLATGIAAAGTATGPAGIQINMNAASFGGLRYIRFANTAGTEIGSVARQGAASVAYNTTSDGRLKLNQRDSQYGLDDLLNIQIKDFNWITDNASDTGFIAQQLYTVYPVAVTKGDTGIESYTPGQTNTWSVDYGRVTPLLTKSIQDLAKLTVATTSTDSLRSILDSLASSTSATSTLVTLADGSQIQEDTFMGKFLKAMTERMITWFSEATNGITNFFAKKVYTEEVCLKKADGTDLCVTGDQLEDVMNSQGVQTTVVQSTNSVTTSTTTDGTTTTSSSSTLSCQAGSQYDSITNSCVSIPSTTTDPATTTVSDPNIVTDLTTSSEPVATTPVVDPVVVDQTTSTDSTSTPDPTSATDSVTDPTATPGV